MLRAREAERQRLLGLPQAQEGNSIQAASPKLPNRDATRKERSFTMGISRAPEVLAAYGVSFQDLRMASLALQKPFLDIGASGSTFALEAVMNDIPVYSTDAKCKTEWVKNTLQEGISCRRATYTSRENAFAAGVRYIPSEEWDTAVAEGIHKVVAGMMVWQGDTELSSPEGAKAPDRAFGMVFAHHSLPQYSSLDQFSKVQLPEILRVTEKKAIFHPLHFNAPGDSGSLERDNQALIQSAHKLSFQEGFRLTVENRPSATFPFAMTGVFERK